MDNLLTVYIILAVWERCQAAIQIAPVNTVVRDGHNSTLYCSFTKPVSDVIDREWLKFGIPTVYFNAQGRTSDAPVQLSIGANFNMVVTRASRQVAALYECRETSDIKRGAWLIYINPMLHLTSTADDELRVKCSVGTGGHGLSWQPSLTLWNGNQTAPASDFQETFYTRTISHIYTSNDVIDGDVITCRLSYGDASPAFTAYQDSTIPPDDKIQRILRKPYNLKITKSPSPLPVTNNDVLKCSSTGTPEPLTYLWLDEDGHVIGKGQLLTIDSNLTSHSLTCLTRNVVGNSSILVNDESIEHQLSEVTGTNNDDSEPTGSNDNSNSNSDQPNVGIGEVKRSEASLHGLSVFLYCLTLSCSNTKLFL